MSKSNNLVSVDAEKAVLGCILVEPNLISEAYSVITKEYFYLDTHQKIYDIIARLYEAKIPINLISIAEELKKRNLIQDIPVVYLAELINSISTTVSFDYYLKLLRQKYLLRFGKTRTLEFLNSLRNEFSFFEYEKYKSDIENIISKHNIIEFYKFSEHKDSIMEDLEKRKLEFKSGVKYSTSLRDLDRVINGLHETDFVVVGARTSTGKTSLCLQMAYNLSKNYPVIYFSTEMPERDLRDRIICNQLGLEYFDIRIGKYTDEVLNMIKEFNRTEKSELYLSFCPSVTFESIKQTVDKISPKFVFIDYIQQIKIRQDKVREIEDFCSSMKILSGEKNCCIIAVSQLSRDLDTLSRRPRLSDLKWSGGQEESADVVLLLSRGNELGNKVYETIIDIAKQRNGPIDSITVAFDSKSMKFADIDRKE